MCAARVDLFSHFNMKLETVAINGLTNELANHWGTVYGSKKMIIKHRVQEKIDSKPVGLGRIQEFEVLL